MTDAPDDDANAEIEKSMEIATEIFDEIFERPDVEDPILVIYSLWCDAIHSLIGSGWNEPELMHDLLDHMAQERKNLLEAAKAEGN